jgi:hypothetical protein
MGDRNYNSIFEWAWRYYLDHFITITGFVGSVASIAGLALYFVNSSDDESFRIRDPEGLYYRNIEQLRQLAEEGDPRAQNFLGVSLARAASSASEAKKWFFRAASQGNTKAQFNLARMFETGDGGIQDFEIALKWYLKAAHQGDPRAQFSAALIFVNGAGEVKQNYETAFELFNEAAQQGYIPSYPHIGLMLLRGEGIEMDIAKAVAYFRAGAEAGNAKAQQHLAWRYFNGEGVPRDYEQALRWFRAAADQGALEAMVQIGFMYEKGLGVKRSIRKACEWNKWAAEKDNMNAQKNLGVCFLRGEEWEKSKEKALFWIKRAASKGHPEAVRYLRSLE